MVYFDRRQAQYQEKYILNPPTHTKIEIEKVISYIPSNLMQVTDFGAGTGRFTIPLLKLFKVKAIDVSRKSLLLLQQTARKMKLGEKLSIGTKLGKSKMIVGGDILHHIDISQYFPLFFQNLEKGGGIVFSEPNGWNLFWYWLIFSGLDWKEEKGITRINFVNVRKQLKLAGFKEIKIEGLGILPGPLCLNNAILCRLNYWLGSWPLVKFFAYRLIIRARKN